MRKPRLEKEPGLADEVAALVRCGAHPDVAAKSLGIPYSTHDRWMHQGEVDYEGERETAYSAYWEKITRAEGGHEVELVGRLSTAADQLGNSVNAKFIAERRYQDRWGPKVDVRVRDQAAEHLLRELREGLDPATYARVLAVLVPESGSEGTDGLDA